jgi:carbamoyl-phosphate synthase large subunit
MKILLSTIGRRSYIANYFKDVSPGNIHVIGTSDRHSLDTEFTVGLLSCNESFIVPPINAKNYTQVLLEVCRKNKVAMICSFFDQDCHALSEHLDEFYEMGTVPFLPNRNVSDICLDKIKTIEFLKDIGVGSPATYASIEAFKASKFGYPVVVKPRYGFASLNMFIVNNDRELFGCFEADMHIIQEMLPGAEYGIDILNDLNGQVLSCVVKRKLKMRAGETDQAITVKDKRLLDLAVFLGESMGHAGPLDVDVFATPERISVLEFNPRFGGGYPLSHAAGARFPELMLDMAKGKQPKSIIGSYQADIVMMKDINVVTRRLQNLNVDYLK